MIALIFQNHYERLQVDRRATDEEIKTAFRKLARIHHPDVALDKDKGHRAFLLIKESYEVLLDPERREDYDQLISASERFKRRHQQAGPAAGKPPPARPAPAPRATARASRPAPPPGPAFDTRRPPRTDLDNFATLEISLEEALHGARQVITLETDSVKFADHTFQSLDVTIPPLTRRGHTLRVAGRGHLDRQTGERGDLILTIAYARHERFRLLGDHLYTSTDLYPWEGALGAFVRIPTLDGFANLRIPPGSQPWQSFRLTGQGMPRESGQRGDLIVSLRFLQPPASTPEQVDLWKRLKAAYR